MRPEIVEQLTQEHPISQGLRQVEHLGRVPGHSVVGGEHFAMDEPLRALAPGLHASRCRRTDGPGPWGFGVLSGCAPGELRAARPLEATAPTGGVHPAQAGQRACPAPGPLPLLPGAPRALRARSGARRCRRRRGEGARLLGCPGPALPAAHSQHTRALQERPHASGEGARDEGGTEGGEERPGRTPGRPPRPGRVRDNGFMNE